MGELKTAGDTPSNQSYVDLIVAHSRESSSKSVLRPYTDAIEVRYMWHIGVTVITCALASGGCAVFKQRAESRGSSTGGHQGRRAKGDIEHL